MERLEWTKEWPREPGWYWFYGKQSRYAHENRLSVVRVGGPTLSGNYTYSSSGMYVYESEACGLWQKITTPEIPEVSP